MKKKRAKKKRAKKKRRKKNRGMALEESPPMIVVEPWAKSSPPMRIGMMRLQWKIRRLW